MTAQFSRFVVVGSIGFVVDSSITLLLTRLSVSPFMARVPALITAMLVTWLLNRRLTFRVNRPKSGDELARYVAVAGGSALANFVVYSGLVLAGLHPLVAITLSTGALMLFSYFAYREFAFR